MTTQTIDERWERLLLALQQANALPDPTDEEQEVTLEEDVINALACELFISRGQNNRVEMNAFAAYANCRFVTLEQDSFGPLVMGIKYGGRTYSYG